MVSKALSPLAAKIVELIESSGRKDSEVARASGISRQYLSDLRCGVRGERITAEVAVSLLRALGVSPGRAGAILFESYPGK
jgi:transcriptional regulator with XRE-family HTH domain